MLLISCGLLLGHDLPSGSLAGDCSLHLLIICAFVKFEVGIQSELIWVPSGRFLLPLSLSCLREVLIASLMVLIVYHVAKSAIISTSASQSHAYASSARKYSRRVQHQLLRGRLVSLLFLLERNCQSIEGLLIVNGCFKVEKPL